MPEATSKQLAYIGELTEKAELGDDPMDGVKAALGKKPKKLTKEQASDVIQSLRSKAYAKDGEDSDSEEKHDESSTMDMGDEPYELDISTQKSYDDDDDINIERRFEPYYMMKEDEYDIEDYDDEQEDGDKKVESKESKESNKKTKDDDKDDEDDAPKRGRGKSKSSKKVGGATSKVNIQFK